MHKIVEENFFRESKWRARVKSCMMITFCVEFAASPVVLLPLGSVLATDTVAVAANKKLNNTILMFITDVSITTTRSTFLIWTRGLTTKSHDLQQ